MTPQEAVRVLLHLEDRVAAATPGKGRKAAPAEQVAAYQEAERRREAFIEALDPGNGARPAVLEARDAEELAQRFGF